MAGSYSGTVELLNDVRLEGLLAFVKRLFPLLHELVDLVDINPFINNAMKIVSDVDVLVKKMKDNVHKIHQLME